MKIPAQQNGNPLAACYCSQLDKALSEVNYAKPLKRQFLSQMQDSLCNYLEAHPDARLEDLYAAFGTPQEAADSALLNTDSAQIKKQLEEKGALNPAQQLTYDMATKGASAVSAENLTPIIDWYKTKEG